MKKIILSTMLIPTAILLLGWGFKSDETIDFSFYSTQGLELYFDVPFEDEIDTEILSEEIVFYPLLGKSYMGFREAMGFKESRGDYFVINDFGYMGKYQFGRSTLRDLGIYNTEAFLNNPELQENAFKAYLARNKWNLRKYIHAYSGKTVGGVHITESGILAAAHLAGPGNVKKFLRSGGADVFTDGFGTSVRYYLRLFSGYDVSHIVPVKNPKIRT